MPLTHNGIVIDLFCWKTNDLLELINCYCLDAMLLFFVVVNSWIVVSFNLLCFFWGGVRSEGCICFWVWFFIYFIFGVYLCMHACVYVCFCVCLCVRCLVAVFEWVTVTYGAFVILKQTEFKKNKKNIQYLGLLPCKEKPTRHTKILCLHLKQLFICSNTHATSRFITLPKPRTDLFKTSFSFSGASLWNTVPTQIKSCNSLASKHSSTNDSEAVCCK